MSRQDEVTQLYKTAKIFASTWPDGRILAYGNIRKLPDQIRTLGGLITYEFHSTAGNLFVHAETPAEARRALECFKVTLSPTPDQAPKMPDVILFVRNHEVTYADLAY